MHWNLNLSEAHRQRIVARHFRIEQDRGVQAETEAIEQRYRARVCGRRLMKWDRLELRWVQAQHAKQIA
jgi:hypothetical protein